MSCIRWLMGAVALTMAGVAYGGGTRISLSALTVGDGKSFLIDSASLTATGAVLATGNPGTGGSADAEVAVSMGEIHAQTAALIGLGAGYSSRTTVAANARDEVFANGILGTNVIVRWFLPITGSASGMGEGLVDATFQFFTQSFNDNTGVAYRVQISNSTTTYDSYFGSNGDRPFVDVTYQVGQNYNIALSFDSTINVQGGNGASAGALDYGNTAHAYATVLTPGASLGSISGHDYAAPVPEPASLAAVGLGLLGLRRRRKG